jgi:hypothetical protein
VPSDTRSFLRLCLKVRREPAAREAMRAAVASEPPDWREVARVIETDRIGPLLHRLWREESFVPDAVQQRLRQSYLLTAHRNLLLLRELEATLTALEAAGVDTLVLKGAALAEVVYHNIGLRPLMDVDLLMRREQLATAMPVLTGRGFAPTHAETREGSTAAYENEMLLIKPGTVPIPLEIHWSLFDSPYYQERLRLEFCWQHAQTFRLGETEARMLDPVSQVLHLCGHLVLHHGGQDLLWENDIAEFVALHGASIDWPTLLERARLCELVLPVQQLLLRLVEEDAHAIPADVVEQLRALQPTAGEERVVGYLSTEQRTVGRRFWTDMASMSRWSERFGYAWTHLFPSAAYMRQRYGISHPLLLPFYYPYRWFRGLRG